MLLSKSLESNFIITEHNKYFHYVLLEILIIIVAFKCFILLCSFVLIVLYVSVPNVKMFIFECKITLGESDFYYINIMIIPVLENFHWDTCISMCISFFMLNTNCYFATCSSKLNYCIHDIHFITVKYSAALNYVVGLIIKLLWYRVQSKQVCWRKVPNN